MDTSTRIAQFEKMATDDPDNDMAHFSLAGAYAQAGRFADAAASFERCIGINPEMSKAYQLAGEAYLELSKRERAVEVLSRGFEVAARRGDRIPQKKMEEMLLALGAEVPRVAAAPRRDAGTGEFVCRRSGKPGTRMPAPPFRGPVGAWIHRNISRETFDAWIAQGTKVINELRLDLSRDEDAEVYDQHMREFLGIDEERHAALLRGEQG